MKKLLVIDIGGNSVKPAIVTEGKIEKLEKIESSRYLTPGDAVGGLVEIARSCSGVAIGYPGIIKAGAISDNPKNLGTGWKGYDFVKSLKKPVTVMNDAAMQALGSYEGSGRMLFLGLGYGLGTCLVDDWKVLPLEAGHLPFKNRKTFEEMVGTVALKRLGLKGWTKNVHEAVERLSYCLLADFVVVGGGNSKKLKRLPRNCWRGDNDNAFLGGWRAFYPKVKQSPSPRP